MNNEEMRFLSVYGLVIMFLMTAAQLVLCAVLAGDFISWYRDGFPVVAVYTISSCLTLKLLYIGVKSIKKKNPHEGELSEKCVISILFVGVALFFLFDLLLIAWTAILIVSEIQDFLFPTPAK